MNNTYRITITMKAEDSVVGFEVQSPTRIFSIALIQMMLGETARQLKINRLHNIEGDGSLPGLHSPPLTHDFVLQVEFDADTKLVRLIWDELWRIPLAQMCVDEVLRLVQEQRNYSNVKITQQRLAEERMMADLGRAATHGHS